MFTVGLVMFFIGVALLGISGISFRLRALANKRAWEGITRPALLAGIIIVVIALILIYLFYPQAA